MNTKKIILFFDPSSRSIAVDIKKQYQSDQMELFLYDSLDDPFQLIENHTDLAALLLVNKQFLEYLPLMKHSQTFIHSANTFFLMTDSVAEDGSSREKTEIHTLSHIMAFRDFWYDEWIRLRKFDHVDAQTEQHNEKIQWAKVLSVSAVSAFIRHINQTDYIYYAAQDTNIENYFEPIPANSIDLSTHIQTEHVRPLSSNTTKSDTDQSTKTTFPKEKLDEKQVVMMSSSPPTMIIQESDNIFKNQQHLNDKTEDESEDKTIDLGNSKPIEIVNKPMKKSNMKNAVSLEQIQKMIDNQSIKDARKELKKIIENDPYHTEAILMLARLLYQHMDDSKKEVIKLFKKALVMIEDDAALFNEFGLVQQQYGAHGKAIDLFREAIIHDANDGAIYHNLAYSLLQKGYIERARANYLQATLLDHQIQTDQFDELYGVIRSSEKVKSSETDPKSVLKDIKTILVTGSSSGIGRAIAMRFIEQGHRVIISGRRKEKLDEILNDLKTKDLAESVVAMSMDVTDLDSIQNGLRSLPAAFSEIDILINNAGLAKGKDPIHQGRFDHWNTMIDTNIKGILHMTRLISPGMVERNKGHIINIGSIAGKEVYPGGSVYCASKAAVESLTKSMRLDLHAYNIKVSAVCPGHVDETEFAAVRYDDKAMNSIYDDFKPLSAKDVADMVFFIADRAPHVNIQDVLMFGTQQANATTISRTGRTDRENQ